MEILLTTKNISKSYGVRPLFEKISFVVGAKERIGLIGPNGAGKSTLLQILAQNTSVDEGDISFRRGLRVGFLKQTPELDLESNVATAVFSSAKDEALAGEILSKLNLQPVSEKRVKELSGGWRKRVALAKELVKEPDLLLLDEPTNHLDIESILWLEGFLARAEFATLTVTHDRLFLQRVTNRILELDRRNPNGLLSVDGDYATYVERKSELLANQQKLQTVLENKLRRETEWLRRGPKARTTKQQARIDAAHNLMDDVSELSDRNQHRTARIDFGGVEKKPKRLIEAKSISKSFGNQSLFKNLDLFIGPRDRIGLLGNNGCGKSTLIRTLLGQERPDSGEVYLAQDLKVAYFEQNRESLDPEITLRKAICPHGDEVNFRGRMIHVNGYLDRFLFRKEQVDVAVGRLSGGEQARLLLARLMLREANVLVLDEPTNDLDVETLDVLEECLVDFDGAVILVTHDRYFLDQVATQIEAFTPKGIITFASLEQWENWVRSQNQTVKTEPAKSTASASENKKKRRLGFNETRELSQMEENIQQAEARLKELENLSQLPENVSNSGKLAEIYSEISALQSKIEKLYSRWSELEALKAESES